MQCYRVARIITRLNIGGPSIQAINLSTDLAAHGFQTCLIHGRLGSGEGDMTTLLPPPQNAVYIESLVRPVAPLCDVRAFWHLYRELRRWRPDIVHTHMAKAGALGRLAALLYNRTTVRRQPAKLVHTYHGHVFDGYFASASTRLFLAVERWLAKRTDALVAISPQVEKDVVETYAVARRGQVRQIHLGFNLDPLLAVQAADRAAARTALDVPADSVVVTTVGRLTQIKQHSLFLDMAAELARRSSRYIFLIAGDGELRKELEALARYYGIESRVRFLGWRGDLPTIYGATDIFVLTSRSEGTPVALIEAMAAAVPSVSTDVGGIRDVVTSPEIGKVVPFGDGTKLADAVDLLAADPSGRAVMAERARNSVRARYDARRLVSDITRLYCDLLATRSTIIHQTP